MPKFSNVKFPQNQTNLFVLCVLFRSRFMHRSIRKFVCFSIFTRQFSTSNVIIFTSFFGEGSLYVYWIFVRHNEFDRSWFMYKFIFASFLFAKHFRIQLIRGSMNSITCCELHSVHSLRFKDNKNQYLLQMYFYVAQTLTVEEMKAQLQQCNEDIAKCPT